MLPNTFLSKSDPKMCTQALSMCNPQHFHCIAQRVCTPPTGCIIKSLISMEVFHAGLFTSCVLIYQYPATRITRVNLQDKLALCHTQGQ